MNSLDNAQQKFIQALSRISHFWGFPKAMGAIYAALYLSPDPLSQEELGEQVSVTKGAVSTNIRMLERIGMVHRRVQIGERKDYFTAETDFWKIIKGILREREKSEFDLALNAVTESLEMARSEDAAEQDSRMALFYQQRLQSMVSFFHTLDNLVAAIMALDELRLGALEKIIGKK